MTHPGPVVARSAVRGRLMRAADEMLQRVGVDQVTIEMVAEAAGVARSTAFRHFGGRDQMITAVGLSRSRSFATECRLVMDQREGTFAKLEAAFVYLADALAHDAIMRELFVLTTAADFGPDALAIANTTLGPTIEAGQCAGDVRSDISTDEVVRWIVEQLYLAIMRSDRSEASATRRFRAFLTPALAGHDPGGLPGAVQSRLQTVDSALARACEAASALREVLTGGPAVDASPEA